MPRYDYDEIIIEEDVPVPAARRGGPGRKPYHPVTKLEIGQSYFIPANGKDAVKRHSCGAHAAARRLDRLVKVRSVDGGVRVWRIS